MVKQLYGSEKALIRDDGILCIHCYNSIGGDYLEEVQKSMGILDEVLEKFLDDEYDEQYDENYEEYPYDSFPNSGFKPKKTQNNFTKETKKIDINRVYKEITSNVIGQDEQIKNIISVLVRNNMTSNPYFKSNIFLIGGTGNGKSETIKQIAKKLDIPYVLEDSSKYTQEGYVGESVENAVLKLINMCNGDISKAEHGIIIFDEIDKKTDNGDRSGVSTTSVQDSLLKILEGTIIHTPKGVINTELITFVMIGACENTFEERKRRLSGKGRIGFSNDDKLNDELKNPAFIPQDLINSGFKSEFVGRIDMIQEFNPMDINMATKIINESKISIFNFYIEELKKLNVDIVMDRKEIISSIAKRAVSLNTGARGIRQIVVDMFKNIYSYIMTSDITLANGYDLYISQNTVYDNKDFRLCKKKIQN